MQPIELTSVTSVFAATTMLTLVIGYLRAFSSKNGAVFHLIASICLVFTAYVLRTVYWDIVWLRNQEISTAVSINVVFDIIAIWGGVHGHLAMYHMIPEHERVHWTPLAAWLYPSFTKFRCFRDFIATLTRWRS